MRRFGVYIHFPWCRNRCPYCDFAIAIAGEGGIPHEAYLECVLAELDQHAGRFAGGTLVSIYFGGGTPSLWSQQCLARVVARVREVFTEQSEVLEVTLEANPTDCTDEGMAGWLGAGINRLSIGVQSTRADELVTLGRDHSMGDGIAALESALSAGFQTLSADVIVGTPGGQAGIESVETVSALEPPHLSVYELTIEQRTPMAAAVRRGEMTPRDDDELAAIYTETHHELEARGYEHYEISSYAKPGHRAVHNSLYWSGREFLGLGNGAASFAITAEGGERWTNHRAVGRYMGAPSGYWVGQSDTLTPLAMVIDRIWLGLRTLDGVSEVAFEGRDQLLEWLLSERLAVHDEKRIRPTLRGFLYADEVARRTVAL